MSRGRDGLPEAWRWRLPWLVGLALLVVLLGSHIWRPDFYVRAELLLQDVRLRVQRAHARVEDPVLIDIDEASLASIGPWPWPRELVAYLVTRLQHAGARLVVLDMLFPDIRDSQGDAALRALLARPGVVVGVLPALGTASSLGQARCSGHIASVNEQDGVVRHVRPWQDGRPMLALAALACDPARAALFANYRQHLRRQLALSANDRADSVLIPWRHTMDEFTVLPATALLAGPLPRHALAGRVVLVGSSAIGLADRIASPLQSPVSGMMVHAELLADALAVDHVRPSDWRLLSWCWSLGALILLGMLTSFEHGTGVITLWLSLLAGWVLVLGLLPVLHPLHPLLPLVVLGAVLLQLPAEWLAAQARFNQLGRRMARYLPRDVLVETLRQHRSGRDVTAPSRREITVMFADLDGFTRIAEQMSPERLSELMSALLEVMTQVVHNHRGTLDKYLGDGLMAFWGAPLQQDDQVDLALDTAVALQRSMDAWNASDRLQRFPELGPLHVSIGIHHGEAVVGDLGSSQRQTYTAMGDTVNVAQRLQEQAKGARGMALVGATVAAKATRHVLLPVSNLSVRGRSGELAACLLIGKNP